MKADIAAIIAILILLFWGGYLVINEIKEIIKLKRAAYKAQKVEFEHPVIDEQYAQDFIEQKANQSSKDLIEKHEILEIAGILVGFVGSKPAQIPEIFNEMIKNRFFPDPETEEDKVLLSGIYNILGVGWRHKGQIPAAISAFDRAESFHPPKASLQEIYYNRGYTLLQSQMSVAPESTGKLTVASFREKLDNEILDTCYDEFSKAVDFDHKDVSAWSQLAMVCWLLARTRKAETDELYEEAIECWQKALSITRNGTEKLTFEANIKMCQQEFDTFRLKEN